MKKKHRKCKPQPPEYFWYGITDGCWFCKNKSGCGNCKIAKSVVAEQKRKIKKKEERKEIEI